MPCKLLGIDSSTSKTGISVFVNGKYAKYYLIDVSTIKDVDEKFNTMCLKILKLLDTEKPNIIAIERMHTLRNADSFRKLCKILGVIQGWCISHDCEYFELSPTEWRKWINTKHEKLPRDRVGLKAWSIDKVMENHQINVTDDIADAICIGEAYINLCNSYEEKKNGK